jgi:hypothetical protein
MPCLHALGQHAQHKDGFITSTRSISWCLLGSQRDRCSRHVPLTLHYMHHLHVCASMSALSHATGRVMRTRESIAKRRRLLAGAASNARVHHGHAYSRKAAIHVLQLPSISNKLELHETMLTGQHHRAILDTRLVLQAWWLTSPRIM